MVNILELIDTLIAEHESGNEKTASLQEVANLAVILKGIDSAQARFSPGRLDQQKELIRLELLMQSIIVFLKRHFEHEETVLLQAVEEICDREMMESFLLLLNEHDYLKTRIRRVSELIQELQTGSLTYQHWNSSANDMKAYLSHTRKLLAIHAESETELFLKLKQRIIEHTSSGKHEADNESEHLSGGRLA